MNNQIIIYDQYQKTLSVDIPFTFCGYLILTFITVLSTSGPFRPFCNLTIFRARLFASLAHRGLNQQQTFPFRNHPYSSSLIISQAQDASNIPGSITSTTAHCNIGSDTLAPHSSLPIMYVARFLSTNLHGRKWITWFPYNKN